MRQTTTWTAQARLDRDQVEVFVVRYSWPERSAKGQVPLAAERPVKSEHLTTVGWREHGEGYVIQPALTVPGWLIHSLPKTDHFYPTLAEQQVMALLDRVLRSY